MSNQRTTTSTTITTATTTSPLSKSKSSTQSTNPVLSRYLTTPITFTPAKHQENYSSTSQHLPASYIILSKNTARASDSKEMKQNGSINGSAVLQSARNSGKGVNSGVKRPKSLAEAVASYSGNKYDGPRERKRKRKLAEMENREKEKEEKRMERLKVETDDSDDEGQEYGVDEVEYDDGDLYPSDQPQVKKSKGLWGSLKSLFGGVSNGEEEEDVGEVFVEGEGEVEQERESNSKKFNFLQREGGYEEGGSPLSSSSSADEIYDENSPFTGFSEPEKSETGEEEEGEEGEEEEEEDPDFEDVEVTEVGDSTDESDEEGDVSYNENEIEASHSSTESTPSLESDAGDGEYVDEDKDVDKLRHDLKIDQLVNGQGRVHTITRRVEKREEKPKELVNGQDGVNFVKSSSTPPTSPEDSDEQKSSKFQNQYYAFNELPSDCGSNGSTRIYKNWRELTNAKPPVGLLNHGVTCYMNSAIQTLIHIPAFQHYLNDINQGKVANLKPRSISHILADLSRRMWNPNKPTAKYINPKRIIQRLDDINCMMSEWQQEDSHEYYMSLMSRLQEDSVPKGHKLNESIIYDIFGGLLHQRIDCQQCHNISSTRQEFYDLSLGLNKKKYQNSCRFTIEKSINEFFSNEVIRKNDQDSKLGYFCDKCQAFTQANKISSILTAPETLTIHLKRFKFDGNSLSKVKQGISYSKYLDLTKYMDRETTEHSSGCGDDGTTPVKYQLIAVIVHEGRSISSGHYICHVLQPDGVSWSTYDDEYINRIDERKALLDANAYVLVYTKLTPKEKKKKQGIE